MKRSLIVLCFALSSVALWAKTPNIAKLTELTRGEKAIGFTVFRGLYPEKFDVTLMGTDNEVGQVYVLAEISGLPGGLTANLQNIGAVHGMSGSPVFIGCANYRECKLRGKMVGALSMRPDEFPKGGINAYITPAEDMFGAHAKSYGEILKLQPPKPPLESTKDDKHYASEKSAFGGFSLEPCDARAKSSDFDMGSAIGIFLAKGDAPFVMSGTVTWKDSDTGKIYIFGHEITRQGNVRYPFAQIKIEGYLQTAYDPSHLQGCIAGNEGTITVDSFTEASGVVGEKSPLVPFNLALELGSQVFRLHEEFIPGAPFTPQLIAALSADWAAKHVGHPENLSLAYTGRIVVTGEPEVFIKNFLPYDGMSTPVGTILKVLSILQSSGFEYTLESISLDGTLGPKPIFWGKSAVVISPAIVNPCKTAKLSIALKKLPEGVPVAVKEILIPVPCDILSRTQPVSSPMQPLLIPNLFLTAPADERQVFVSVQSGLQFTDMRAHKLPSTLEELIGRINELTSLGSGTIYVQIVYPPAQIQTPDPPKKDPPKIPADDGLIKASREKPAQTAGNWTRIENPEQVPFLVPEEPKPEVLILKLPPLPGIVNLNEHLAFTVKKAPEPQQASQAQPTAPKRKKKKKFLLF